MPGCGVFAPGGDVLALSCVVLSSEKKLKSDLMSMLCLKAGLDSSELKLQGCSQVRDVDLLLHFELPVDLAQLGCV